MGLQASTIRTEINKAGVLWDAHVKQIRYRARRLSSGRDHKGSKETRELYKKMDSLNQAYQLLLHKHNYDAENSDSQVHRKLSEMRSQVDSVKNCCDTIINRLGVRLDLFSNNVKEAFAQDDKSNREPLLESIRTFCRFIDKLILQHKTVSNLHEGYIKIKLASSDIPRVIIHPHQIRFVTARDLDQDREGAIKKALTETLPKLAKDFIDELRKGIEAWYQQADQSYSTLINSCKTS